MIIKTNEKVFIQYTEAIDPDAKIIPAIPGPDTEATWDAVMFILIALARCFSPTNLGIIAVLAGIPKHPIPALIAVRTYSV